MVPASASGYMILPKMPMRAGKKAKMMTRMAAARTPALAVFLLFAL